MAVSQKHKGFKWTVGDASNPTLALLVDNTSRALHIAEAVDAGTDWNVAADTHPSVYIHSATTPATDYIKMWHDATDAYFNAAAATTLYFQIAGTTEMELAAAALTLSAPLTVGVDDTGYDVTLFGATAGAKMLWDESDNRLEFDGADINLQDSDILQFGDAQDVAITWDASNLVITPAVDDTGSIRFGNGTLDMDVRFTLGATGDYVEMNVGNKQLNVTIAALPVGDSYSGVRVAVTAAAANNAYGMAGYFDSTITGTTAGHCYGLGSWINTATTPVLSAGNIIVPFEGGVWTGEAQANARIVFGGQHQAVLNGAPATLHAWRLNTSHEITALIAAANAGSVHFAASEAASTAAGTVALFDIAGGTGVRYIQLYSVSS